MPLVRAFRVVAIAEALSWLALIVATIVKYSGNHPLGVQVLGPIHGVLFLAYVALALAVRGQLNWSTRTALIVLADSVLPGGGFLAARRPDVRAALDQAADRSADDRAAHERAAPDPV
jgi:integral membrane protein